MASGRANGSRSFSLQIEPADLAVRADREKFAQVLDNLLDNAVRYSPEGGTISIAARGRRGSAEITVADEGVGIAEADRRRVFRLKRSACGAPQRRRPLAVVIPSQPEPFLPPVRIV